MLETIEIDPEVGSSLGLAEGTIVRSYFQSPQEDWEADYQVEISIIRNPTKARSITVTPLTSDDWEILVSFSLLILVFKLNSRNKMHRSWRRICYRN